MTLTIGQLAMRQTGISASEVADVLQVGDYADPMRVWMRKVDPTTVEPTTIPMRRGHALEPLICELYEEETGHTVTRCTETMRCEGFPWMLATPDGFVGEDRLVEFKAPGTNSQRKWKDGAFPEEYLIQCMAQMVVTGRAFCDLVGLMDSRIEIRRLEYDTELAFVIIERCKAFWFDHVVAKVPPNVANVRMPRRRAASAK